jgi:RNA polymerase sigma-70 factor, ECF subfamily
MSDAIAAILRRSRAPALAALARSTRDLCAAEDAVQEAMARALASWPARGLPDAPDAWLVEVAANAFRDGLRKRKRREAREAALEALAARSPWSEALLRFGDEARWRDDATRLLFTCADPVIAVEERAALALSTIFGMSTTEIARAFLVDAVAMERRLGRARERLRARRSVYEIPRPEDAPERLDAALATIHLAFNEGYWASAGDAPIRRDLVRLALHLARAVDAMLPRVPEVEGLLALLLLHQARMAARVDAHGAPLTLEQQDRSKWDSATIDEASQLLRDALGRGRPGPYQIDAAIAAVHCSAARAEDTDWAQIAILYDALEQHRADPVVRVNRAFAASRAHGPEEGLRLLAAVADHPSLARYPYLHLVRGVLLGDAGEHEAALDALSRARDLATNRFERAQIEARMARLRGAPG